MKRVAEVAVTQLITSRWNADWRISGQTIDVCVANNEIVLVGFCDSEEQRTAAETIASGLCGVCKIVSKIKVRRISPSI